MTAATAPETTPDATPDATAETKPPKTVLQALVAVMCDIGAVGKNRENRQQNFKFRGIDDLVNAVAGPMRAHSVLMFPEVVEHGYEIRSGKNGHYTVATVKVKYTFVGPDGGERSATIVGEAADQYDKATNKAMSAALKYALLQVFMIPTDWMDDSDKHSPQAVATPIDYYIHQLQQREVWYNPNTLNDLFQKAKTANLLAHPVDDGQGGTTTLGELIGGRAALLVAEEEQRQARRAAEKEDIHRQLMAEHPEPDPDQWATPAPGQQAPAAVAAAPVSHSETPAPTAPAAPAKAQAPRKAPAKKAAAKKPTAAAAPASHSETPAAATRPAPAQMPQSPQQMAYTELLNHANAQAKILGTSLTKHLGLADGADPSKVDAMRLTAIIKGNRHKVIEALRQQGRATTAEAYAATREDSVFGKAKILEETPEEGAGG
ncbi:ERF family protein [Actinacidiphila sp. bgisy160]|uniref:ERF family protein n=1 Tax=Actinacidiphila sp. bgisy160 TaxID=3413796 RepID=UPI003D7600AF